MAEKETVLYEWLKAVDPKIVEQDHIPLGGFSPEFPWEEFSQKISQSFQIEDFKFEKGNIRWLSSGKLSQDLGDNLFTQQISISAFEGNVYFVVDLDDLRYLMYSLLTRQPPSDFQIFDEELEQGFYRYLSLEAVHCFSEINFDQSLNLHLLQEKTLHEEECLGIDIRISLFDRIITARLLIPQEFLHSWSQHYSERTLATPVSPELLKKIEIPFHIEIGKVRLTQEELKTIEEGDLVLLDQCYIDPENSQGQVVLTLSGSPKIRASLEKNHIKILESPLFHEDINPLVKGEKR